MKKNLFIALAIISTVFTACNQDKIDELNSKNTELSENSADKEETINEMLASFNEIQSNLKEIKAREGMIEVTAGEGQSSDDISGDINKDIEIISNLMKQNDQLLQSLNNKLKDSNVKMSEFRKLITSLNDRVDSKNREIAELNTELKEKKILIGQLYFRNDSLRFSNQVKDARIEEKIDALNEGFFAYGTFKELKEKNVLTKEGGFLGIGKNKELKNDFNTEYFSKVDIRKQTSFLIYADEAKLITNHPKSSYEFMGKNDKVDSLVIKDIDAFWNTSRYLVIVID